MQVGSQLVEFGSSCLFLQFSFLQSRSASVVIQLFSDLLIFLLDVLQVTLARVEIVFVLPAVESPVVFLYYSSLSDEKSALFELVFHLLHVHELATSDIASPDSLDHHASPLF